jgi:putative acetyltransferase
MNAYTIRPEQEHEFPLIHALIKEAFATAKVSNGDEQGFAARLRVSDVPGKARVRS